MKYHHYLSMPWSRTFGLNVHIQKGVSHWPIINAAVIQIQDRQLVITLNVFSREIQYLKLFVNRLKTFLLRVISTNKFIYLFDN